MIIVCVVCVAVFLGPNGSISQRNVSYPKESQDALHSYLEGGKRILYSPAGVITETLSVDKATKFIDQPDTLMTGIQYQSKGDGESEWDVQASTGVFKEINGELVLRNGVTIIERSSNVHMRTTSMNLFLNSLSMCDPTTID